MEGYIKRINKKITTKYNQKEQEKIKKRYLVSGGLTLALGLAGFIASFISFIILFMKFETDRAMIAWFVAIPFILMIVAGSVVTRIGDMLLRNEPNGENNKQQDAKEETQTKQDLN